MKRHKIQQLVRGSLNFEFRAVTNKDLYDKGDIEKTKKEKES
jgi:hypothetical protein